MDVREGETVEFKREMSSGAASVPASDSAIIRMIRECDGDVFEARLSMNQDLTFRYAQAEFERKGLPLGPGEMRTLGILNPDGVFTNLGLLLSDQCPPTMKAAAFSDDSRSVFTERREYAGSILKQLADAYAFLQAQVPSRFLRTFRQPLGPPSGTATRRAASRPGSGGTPIRSPRRT